MPKYKGYNDKEELIIERVGATLSEAFPNKYWEILHIDKVKHEAVLNNRSPNAFSYAFLKVKWEEDPQTIAPPPPQTITDEPPKDTHHESEEFITQIQPSSEDDFGPAIKPQPQPIQPTKLNTMNISIDRVDGTSNSPEFIVLTINGHPYIYKLSSQG
jgi:hypothetical protein